jgi:hypothetical protein
MRWLYQSRTVRQLPMPLVFLTLSMLLIGSIWLCVYLWHLARAPMTVPSYEAFCGAQSECYPEIAFFLGACLAALFCLIFAWTLLRTCARFLSSRSVP